MEINKHILHINAELKYIEFLLHALATGNDSKTVGEIKKDFLVKFKTELPHLLDQYFGIIRIIPLLLMRGIEK